MSIQDRLGDLPLTSIEHLACDLTAPLRNGGLLEVEPFFPNEIADSLAAALERSGGEHQVVARRPDAKGDVVGYAPHVTPEEWHTVPTEDRFLQFNQVEGEALTGTPVGSVIRYLASDQFRQLLSSVSDLRLTESYFDMHVMRAGDFIDWHTDAREGRQLGLIVYLSRGWAAADGGLLEARIDGRERAFVPVFNRAVLFGVDALATHRVSVVRGSRPRLTLGMWFL